MFKFIERRIDKIVEQEVQKRKSHIEELIQAKLNEFTALNKRLNWQIKELERTREFTEAEQKRLWERLNILRDNLNTEDVWVKLWECAYSKATDKVWEIMKKETIHLVEIAKEDGYNKAKAELEERYNQKINSAIDTNREKVNVPLLVKKKDEANQLYLTYQRVHDKDKESYYKGQIDLIREIYNENV